MSPEKDAAMALRALVLLAIVVPGATGALAQEERVPPPPGARMLLEAAAQGVQIYTCQKGSDGSRWVFTAPDAALFDAAGRQIGTHFAGPTWQMDDGSKIIGEVVSQAPAPEPHAIAWLLLRVTSHAGSGVLGDAALVRRVDTQGGAAPTTPCAGTQEARMRYAARYLFYAIRQ
ncbi:MAG: DUF3455 domain-containing protein [Acidisphaera sp.]|nr:DUF3455 domain-containing protein [Acidisphaera sp.]